MSCRTCLPRSTDEYPLIIGTGYISGANARPYIILSGVSFEEANAVEGPFARNLKMNVHSSLGLYHLSAGFPF